MTKMAADPRRTAIPVVDDDDLAPIRCTPIAAQQPPAVVGDSEYARAVRPYDENRNRSLLAARSAESDVDIARRVNRGAVDLVKSRRQWRADFDVRRLSRNLFNSNRRMTTVKSRRNDRRQLGGRGGRQTGHGAADRDARKRRFDRQTRPLNRDATTFHGPERVDRGNAGRTGNGHGVAFSGETRA